LKTGARSFESLLIKRVDYDERSKEVAITFRPAGIASLASERRSAA